MKNFNLIKHMSFFILFLSFKVYGSEHNIIAIEVLSQTVKICNHDIEKLWKKRHHVSQNNKRNFQISLGNASENCQKLQKIYTQLCQASEIKKLYDRDLEQAKLGYFPSK